MAVNRYAEWLKRGREHQWQHRPVDAMLCFQRAASLEPRAVDARFLLGEVHWQLGSLPAAVAAWRDAARVAPHHLASQLALAEALLAIADVEGAAHAAAAAARITPRDRAAGVLQAVTAFAVGRDAATLVELRLLVAEDPSRLVSPVTGGTLARSLARSLDESDVQQLLSALVAHRDRVAFALLVPMAHAALQTTAPPELRFALGSIAESALQRPVAPLDVDALREIALACHAAGDHRRADALAKRYAQACVAFVPPGAPLRWPERTAGTALRVVVLMPVDANGAGAALLGDIAGRMRDVAWTLLVASEPASEIVAGGTLRVVGAVPDSQLATALAADDPDVLLDLAGLSVASGPLLAMRVAHAAIGAPVGAPAQAAPLVDDVVAAAGEVVANALERERDRARSRPPSAASAATINERFAAAVQAHQSGDADASLHGYRSVLEAQPTHAPTLHLLGALHREQGRVEEARSCFDAAITHAPAFSDARAAVARLARDRNDFEGARAVVEAGLRLDPRSVVLWRVRGEIELAAHDAAAAQEAFEQALALAPADAEAHYNVGVALQKQSRHNDAARAYQRALAFDPEFVDAHFNLGVVFRETGHPAAAIGAYRAVLERDPRRVGAYSQLGEALLGAARIDEWMQNFRRFEKHCPDALPLAVQALEVCQYAAEGAALEHYLEGLRRERFRASDAAELTDAIEQLLYLLLFFDVEPQMLHRFAQTYAATAPEVYGTPAPPPSARRPGRIRVGYLSGDLRNHVMGKMMWHALRHHDRTRFDVRLYSTSFVRDEWTERFAAAADGFEVIAGLSDDLAAQRLLADDLDLLVDLSGHTKGGRPGILARKPARVQITHVASAGSVGLQAVDFKLTDAFADVPENQKWSIETLLPVAGCVYPYRSIEAATTSPFTRENLRMAGDRVAIGAFVTPMKLSRRCLSLWRDVLERVPRAVLVFSPNHAALRPVFERLCAASGIAADRLVFIPQGRSDAENQARYALIDFVLDPMPFGGVNGVLEPLDAGVPVVTIVGKRHGERTAYSILRNLGVTHTVAQGGREYVDIAVRLAQDEDFMREVREAIRAGLRSSALVDMPAHTRNLEAAYVEALSRNAPETLAAQHG